MNAHARLQRAAARFLAHKRSLGNHYHGEADILRRLCGFVRRSGGADLGTASFARWLHHLRDHHPNTRRKWHQIVRNFCLYRRRSEPGCFIPSDDYAKRQPHVSPVIVEPHHVAGMLALASTLEPSPNSPLRAPVARIAVVLLYTTGMRLGELLRLTVGDVSENGALLHIRESKFHKSRWAPLSPSTTRELRHYLNLRAGMFPADPGAPLLRSRRSRRGYSHQGMQATINRLFAAANICDDHGRRPRVHDLRHSFAVQALIRWFRAGADVQSCLPKLALYMGHVSIESTAHYLHWIPSVRTLASARFERCFGQLVTGGAR